MSGHIRFGEPLEPVVREEHLPPDDLLPDEAQHWRDAPFRVYIVKDVYANIWRHVSENLNTECGGILVGHPFKTAEGQAIFVIVTAAIPQHSDNRSVGHFTVGPAEIAVTRETLEQKYPGMITVGWYHSHPGHGIFLSSQDMTIVHSIYNLPWNIAMVLDPRRDTEGIFVGANGEQLGGRGDKRRGETWIVLNQAPDSIDAIALYNQAQEAVEQNRTNEALKLIDELQVFVKRSKQLQHWQSEYRDIFELRLRVERSLPQITERSATPPPAQTRPSAGRYSAKGWLELSAFATALLIVFFCIVVVLMPEMISHLASVGWGILASWLALITAGYVIYAKDTTVGQSSNVRVRSQLTYTANERLGALGLIALVIIVWGGYLVVRDVLFGEAVDKSLRQGNQSPLLVVPLETATIRPSYITIPVSTTTPTITQLSPTNTATPTSTLTATPTHLLPTPTPMATSTESATPTIGSMPAEIYPTIVNEAPQTP